MRSSSSVSLTGGRGSGSVRLISPPASPAVVTVDTAIEYLMVKKDFQAALDTCEKGLESLASAEQEESCFKHGELKAALTIVGIQALAELNQWRGVLSWVLQQYGETTKIPAKIIQMCILLYVKVGEWAVMKDAVNDWLRCSSNMSQSGFSTMSELYILHILLPMGLTAEALELLESDVGQVAFTEEQRQAARSLVDLQKEKNASLSNPDPQSVAVAASRKDNSSKRLNPIMRLLLRGLSLASVRVRSISLRRVFLAVMLLYLLLIRMDPALPSAFPWLLHLHGLLQQVWNTMFGPYYKGNTRN
ncbi:peroxisome assembly protein 26 [Triplophysa rosa]|uniref:Peroxisome assembly protein 26 n=1 Tax=Triplophysa rosa TaxID=992332 RepID=A0A9W7T945_TRIRA|nr:peroxisome assembly protein 26 [Triplophysa rosa]KAI7792188.1 peroxisome assembly protein 26 [Triplophysa rosa]